MCYINNITEHGYDRLKERTGLKGPKLEKYIEKIWAKGHKLLDYEGKMRKYYKNILDAYNENKDRELRVFGNEVYVFSTEGILITVLNVDEQVKQEKTHKTQSKFRPKPHQTQEAWSFDFCLEA